MLRLNGIPENGKRTVLEVKSHHDHDDHLDRVAEDDDDDDVLADIEHTVSLDDFAVAILCLKGPR